MIKIIVCLMLLVSTALVGLAQNNLGLDRKIMKEARDAVLEEIRLAKQRSTSDSPTVATPADFNDTESFGKGVNFLGSLYAGTVFIAPTCAFPDIPPTIAPDDICVPKGSGVNIPSTPFTRPEWEITIPGKSAKNVFYFLFNHTVQYDNTFAGAPLGGQGIMSYNPYITIVSDALNDPLAIDPVSGLPMNGSFTVGSPGGKFRSMIFTAGQPAQESESYAGVNGRGISRAFWRGVGLPESVIDKFYKKDVTFKFGIRVAQFGAVASGTYFYQVRILGQ